jgi:hypothetical protein
MLNPVGRASVALITPLLKANDESAAAVNWTQLKNMIENARRFNGAVTIELPAGLFYVGTTGKPMIVVDERSAGLTIRGMGSSKTILVPSGDTGLVPFGFVSSRVGHFSIGTVSGTGTTITGVTDIDEYEEKELVYIWTENGGNSRSTGHRRVIQTVDPVNFVVTYLGTNPGVASPAKFKHVKGYAIAGSLPAGTHTIALEDSSLGSRFSLGEDVFIGDGPALNNFYGEWAKVKAISSGTITLDRRLRRSYAMASPLAACIVPGPHMSDITVRDMSIAVPSGTPDDGLGVIRFGLRMQFENVEFIGRPGAAPTYFPLNVVNCGDSAFGATNGTAIVKAWASQDLHIRDGLLAGVDCREFSSDLLFDGITTYRPEGFQCASASGPGPCERIHLVNSRVTNHGDGSSASNVNFVKGSVISNVQIVQPNHAGTPPAISLEDDRITLSAITTDSAISVSGDDLSISQLVSPNGLTLASGSTGILVTPVVPSSATISDSSNGGWRTPVPARLDGRVTLTSSAETHVPLTIVGHADQSVNLQEWKKNDGTVVGSMAHSTTAAGAVFTLLGANFTTLSFTPASIGGGFDCFLSTGALLRMGTNFAGGMVQMFHNGVTAFSGQCYIDCGNQSTSAIIFRTANATERLRITHDGDATFVPASINDRGLVVKGLESQSGDLQVWEDSDGIAQFGIRADGTLICGSIDDGEPTLEADRKIWVYNSAGQHTGFIAIHPVPPPP